MIQVDDTGYPLVCRGHPIEPVETGSSRLTRTAAPAEAPAVEEQMLFTSPPPFPRILPGL